MLGHFFPHLHQALSWHRMHNKSPGLSSLSVERGEQGANLLANFSYLMVSEKT